MEILLFIMAVVLSIVVLSLGLIFNIVMIWKVKDFKKFILNLTLEVWRTIKELFYVLARWLDVLGNVVGGSMFNYLFIRKEYWDISLYGKSGISISIASGFAQDRMIFIDKNEDRQYGFAKFIDSIFKEGHCEKAYRWHLIKETFNKNFEG